MATTSLSRKAVAATTLSRKAAATIALSWEATAAVGYHERVLRQKALSQEAAATAAPNSDCAVPIVLGANSLSPNFKALPWEAAAAVALSGGVLRPQQQFRTVPQ